MKQHEPLERPQLPKGFQIPPQRDGRGQVAQVPNAATTPLTRRPLNRGVDDKGRDQGFGDVPKPRGAIGSDDSHREHDVDLRIAEQPREGRLHGVDAPVSHDPGLVREAKFELALHELGELALYDALDLDVTFPRSVDDDADANHRLLSTRRRGCREGRPRKYLENALHSSPPHRPGSTHWETERLRVLAFDADDLVTGTAPAKVDENGAVPMKILVVERMDLGAEKLAFVFWKVESRLA